MSNERKGFIEVTDIDGIIFTDSKRNDFVIYSEASNQNILIGTQLSNVSAMSVRSNNLHIANRVNIGGGSNVPAVALEVRTTDSVLLPKGTTAQRPGAPVQGYVRYNTDINTFEGFGAGNAWGSLGGVKDTNQDTYISAESFPTSNDDNLVFYNSNIEKMRITRQGYVGINTSNPQYLLHVNGQGYFGEDLYINSNLAVNRSIIMQGLRVRKNTGGQVNFSPISVPGVSNDSFGNLQIYNQNSLSSLGIIFYTGYSNEVGRFTGDGKFSVGKSNPSAQIHVNSPLHNDLLAAYSTSNINIAEIGDAAPSTASTDGTLSLYANATKNVFLRAGGVSYIRGGNLGIGTITPSNTLDVNGNIGITNATIPMGLMTEVGGTTPLLNMSVNFREPNRSNAYRGAGFRIDTRGSPNPIFQWLSRLATSNSDNAIMSLTDVGYLGLGTTTPATIMEIVGTDALLVPKGTTAQRPGTTKQGQIRYNTDTNTFEGYGSGNTWGSLGGIKDTNQDTYISAETFPTSNDDNLVFYNSNVETMRILRGGNVGIGTSNPASKLDINGSMICRNGTISFSNSTNAASLSLSSSANTVLLGIGNSLAFSSFSSGTLSESYGIRYTGNATGPFTVTNASLSVGYTFPGTNIGTGNLLVQGNIGVGTTTPSQQFQIGDMAAPNYFLNFWSSVNITNANHKALIAVNDSNTVRPSFVGLTLLNESLSNNVWTPALTFGKQGTSTYKNEPIALSVYTYQTVNDNWYGGDLVLFARSNETDLIEKVRFKGSGSVGIGTSSPQYTLDVAGTFATSKALITGGIGSTNDFVIYNKANGTGINTSGMIRIDELGNVSIQSAAPSGISLQVANSTRLYVNSNGNVGVGTISPNESLHVSGKIYSTTQFLSLSNDSATAPSFTFKENSNTGMFHAAADALGFSTAGSERMRVISTGNLGIGTSNPSSLLTLYPIQIDGNGFDHSTAPLTITIPTATSTTLLNDRLPVMHLCRQATSGQCWGARATFAISRYENSANNSRTRLDLGLAHNSYDTNYVMTIRSDGNVGVGMSNPVEKLHTIGSILAEKPGANSDAASFLIRKGAEQTSFQVWNYGNNKQMTRIGVNTLWDSAGSEIWYNSSTTVGWNILFGNNSDAFSIIRTTVLNTANTFFYINSSGNIGIGTTSPGSLLDVSSASSAYIRVVSTNNATNANFSLVTTSGAHTIYRATADNSLRFNNGTADVITLSNNNVGIGSTTPDKTLVVGSSPSSSTQIKINGTDGDKFYLTPYDNGSRIGHSAGWSFNFYAGQSNGGANNGLFTFNNGGTGSSYKEIVRFNESGNVGIGTASPGRRLDVNATGTSSYVRISGDVGAQQAIEFYDTATRWIIYKNTNETSLKWWNGTADVMTLLNNGNLGIGTASPAYKLDVSGTIRAGTTGGTSCLLLGDSTDTNSRFISALDSTMTTNSVRYITFGKANSAKNQGELFYQHQTDGGNTNLIGMGFNGVGAIYARTDGNVGIGTSSPAYKLDVSGSICTNLNNIHFQPSGGSVTTNGTYGIYWHNNGGTTPDTNYAIYRSSGAWTPNTYQQLVLSWITGIVLYTSASYDKGYVDIQGGGLRVTSGNVGIGTTSPGYKLEVSGAIYASGDITALSDKRFKEDLQPITNACETVSKLQGFSYTRKDYEKIEEEKGTKHIGLIAQDVQQVLPEVVTYDKVNDKYGINYGSMAGVFVEAIKELNAKVANLESIVEKQSQIIEKLLNNSNPLFES